VPALSNVSAVEPLGPSADAEPASSFLAACRRRQRDNAVPVWFMRQAGRSLPEYRKARRGLGMLESCRRPDLVTEITLQPVRRYGVDAAILYSDIMIPLHAVGVGVEILTGTGPVIDRPIRTARDLAALRPLEPDDIGFISEAVGDLVQRLDGIPLIGFAGAPFTLASYLVEGGPSRDYAKTKALMVSEPELWHELCRRLAELSARFLEVQIRAGARAAQLFDSWAGALSAADYARYVQSHSATVLARARRLGVPVIHFGVGTGQLLPLMAAGADVIGVDWRVALAEASARVGLEHAVQGNLDPALLGARWPVLAERVREVLRSGAPAPGHIFNLGHGVPADADPATLLRIVELVHSEGPALRLEARAGADRS
jgi:uroporphyrinogen decarboxylase